MSNLPPVKGQPFTFDIGLVSQADPKVFKTSPTLANGDVLVSVDGGNFANITSLPTQIQSSGILAVSLTGAEMNGKRITTLFRDAAGAEWCDALVTIYTAAQTHDTVANNVATILADTHTTGVKLADDAITAAKFDETTAHPLKKADAGATEVARTGADGDTLETLSDQLDAAQADLDNPSQYKADVSGLATGAALSTVATNITTLLARIGAFTGTGVNTVLGFLKAIMSKDASTPSDVGGTFSAATDSLEALRDSGIVGSTSTSTTTLTEVRGDTWSVVIEGLGSLVGRTKLWFTIKRNTGDADTDAIVQIEETAKLKYLNGAAATTAADGTLTVDSVGDGDITVVLKPAASSLIVPRSDLSWDVQVLAAGVVTTLRSGTFVVTADVTRTVS